MSLAGPLPDPREHGDALVFLDHGVDQFHDQHGLAHAGAAEHRSLAALRKRCQQVDHLDARLEHFSGRGFIHQRRRRLMDIAPRRFGGQWRTHVAHSPDDVEQASENGIPDGHRDRRTCRVHRNTTGETRGALQCKAADRRGVDMGLYFEMQGLGAVPGDDQGGMDRRQQMRRERHVDDGTANRHDMTELCSRTHGSSGGGDDVQIDPV
ncbi:hypothetical protein GALL_346560 [mine drainage metagenome]|uniref:Uncharacterized protein n=1 Tax=mine drainage metagenome TaxID=410659 RepID=A0A1J5QJT8_9ZZZZ